MARRGEDLVTLSNRLNDALGSFEQARDDVRDGHLRRFFERGCVEHDTAIRKIRPFLPPEADDDGGTMTGGVTRALDLIRTAVGGDGRLLPGMIDCQTRVLIACETACAAATTRPKALKALQDVRRRLTRILTDPEAARATAA